MSYETAKQFWTNRKSYPKYPNLNERRLIDVNFVINNINNPKSLLDIGCGDGYLIRVLRELTSIEAFHGNDLSEKLVKNFQDNWGKSMNSSLTLSTGSIFDNVILPTDVTLSMGSLLYIFGANNLHKLVSMLKSDMFIVRSPCTLKEVDEYIDVYSDQLKSKYSAVYRTVKTYLDVFKSFYKYVEVTKAYPDEIESKYGTKHFYFVCNKKDCI